jgi:hypothetical protein
MDNAVDEAHKDNLIQVIGLWKAYSENSESETWAKIASGAISFGSRESALSDFDAEEVESEVVMTMGKGRPTRALNEFEPEQGPVAFMKYWKALTYNMARIAARNIKRHELGRDMGERELESEDEEGGVSSPMDKVKETRETELDKSILLEMQQDLERFLESRLGHDEVAMAAYEKWIEAATEKGSDSVGLEKDVIQPLVEELPKRGVDVGRSTIWNEWKIVVREIVKFFEQEMGKKVSQRAKRHLKIADMVACSELRSKMASWVLGVNG